MKNNHRIVKKQRTKNEKGYTTNFACLCGCSFKKHNNETKYLKLYQCKIPLDLLTLKSLYKYYVDLFCAFCARERKWCCIMTKLY